MLPPPCNKKCRGVCNISSNFAPDDNLITEAQSIGVAKTKKAAVTEALLEHIKRRKQVRITSLFGEVDYNPEYNYKTCKTRKATSTVPKNSRYCITEENLAIKYSSECLRSLSRSRFSSLFLWCRPRYLC